MAPLWPELLPHLDLFKQGRPDRPIGHATPDVSLLPKCITMAAMLEEPPRPPARRPTGPLDQAAPRQSLYDYYMVQLPSVFPVERGTVVTGTEIPNYVQMCANEFSAAGWEFYRIDTMSLLTNPGCLASLFGASGQFSQYSIITFRRLRTHQQ
jgi:hypothetical protein